MRLVYRSSVDKEVPTSRPGDSTTVYPRTRADLARGAGSNEPVSVHQRETRSLHRDPQDPIDESRPGRRGWTPVGPRERVKLGRDPKWAEDPE